MNSGETATSRNPGSRFPLRGLPPLPSAGRHGRVEGDHRALEALLVHAEQQQQRTLPLGSLGVKKRECRAEKKSSCKRAVFAPLGKKRKTD